MTPEEEPTLIEPPPSSTGAAHGPTLIDTAGTGRGSGPAPSGPARGPATKPGPRTGQIGDYELLGELGRGGMGMVYRARDPGADREVALKLLSGALSDEKARTRFRREAHLTAQLDHPNVVKVHAAGEHRELPFIVYELVEGARELGAVLPGLPREQRLALVRDVARALGAAHALGIVHRDVKPSNVLVDASGRARLADFGLAIAEGQARVTATGAMIGTLSVMSPEQLEGDLAAIGPPTDVWAAGVVLYEAVTGRAPFQCESFAGLSNQIMVAEPTPPRTLDPTVSPELEAVVLRCLRRRPKDRYPDGGALAADLDQLLAGQPVEARPLTAGEKLRARLHRNRVHVGLGAGLLVGLVLLARGLSEPPYSPSQWPPAKDPARLLRAGPVVARPDDAPKTVSSPPWLARLSPERRPPTPLPDGLAWGEAEGEVVNRKDGSTLVWVPAGAFRMGAADGDKDERPVHEVKLAGLFVGKTEVTWAQLERFCAETSRPAPVNVIDDHPGHFEAGPKDPAFHVTWDDARAYCAWAGLRLPSEAEWEYAARGTDGRRFPWGNNEPVDARLANLADDSALAAAPDWQATAGYDDGHVYLSPVGAFPEGASPFGCLDMAGNVWEWVEDAYRPYDDQEAGADEGQPLERVVRGGSWCYALNDCRTSNRASQDPASRFDSVGFRVAR
jgi:formylglycine-generating enzyme required for sulfatase activity